MSRFISLSRTIKNGMPCYGGEPNVFIKPGKSIAAGEGVNTLILEMGSHAGTHIDFPRHFIDGGKTADDYKPDWFVFGKIGIIEIPLSQGGYITGEALRANIRDADIELLLIRTSYHRYYGSDKYWKDSPGLSFDAAKHIKETFHNLRAVGIDFISVNVCHDKTEGRLAHMKLLACPEVLIIEDMDMSALTAAPMRVIAMPLFISGADGAPCNIIAEVEDEL